MLFPERRIDLVLYIQSLRECLPEQLAFESDYWAWVVSCVSFLCARQAYQYLFWLFSNSRLLCNQQVDQGLKQAFASSANIMQKLKKAKVKG